MGIKIFIRTWFWLGFIEMCSNGTNDLQFISPKSERAVSAKGASEWRNKLFILPKFFLLDNEYTDSK